MEFENRGEAEKARDHMDGGQIDGNVVTVQVGSATQRTAAQRGMSCVWSASLVDAVSSGEQCLGRLQLPDARRLGHPAICRQHIPAPHLSRTTHPPPLQFMLLPQYVRWHCSPTLTPYSCLFGEPPLQFVLLPRRRSPPPPVKRAEPERRDDRGRDKRPPSPIRRRSPPRRASPPRRRWGRGGAGDIVCQPADRVWVL